MLKKSIAPILLLLVISAPASATTIDFSTLPGSDLDPLTIYSENGFTVTNISHFEVITVWGNPSRSIGASGIDNGTSGTGSFSLIATGGENFTLVSFDFNPDNSASYAIVGSLGGAPVFNISSSSIGGSFVTIVPGTGADIVDLVTFSFLGTGGSYDVDNIVANAVPSSVPEPASVMLLGIGLLAGLLRKSVGN